MNVLTEPKTLWPDAPQFSDVSEFPPYRFVPGVNPHPKRARSGHSYGKPEALPTYLPPERWRENQLYLYGIDLYHRGYLWESHEAWETLWHLTDKQNAEAEFLRGLIQNSAAQLKLHLQSWQGARHLSQEAYRRIEKTLSLLPRTHQGVFMGLSLSDFLSAMRDHYDPVWNSGENTAPVLSTPPPLIKLLPCT